jgi:hypothetical protein
MALAGALEIKGRRIASTVDNHGAQMYDLRADRIRARGGPNVRASAMRLVVRACRVRRPGGILREAVRKNSTCGSTRLRLSQEVRAPEGDSALRGGQRTSVVSMLSDSHRVVRSLPTRRGPCRRDQRFLGVGRDQ